MRAALLFLLLSLGCAPAHAQPAPAGGGAVRLIVRADDLGAAQAVNEASIRAHRNGIVTSAEVLVPGPWFLDAVRLLRETRSSTSACTSHSPASGNASNGGR